MLPPPGDHLAGLPEDQQRHGRYQRPAELRQGDLGGTEQPAQDTPGETFAPDALLALEQLFPPDIPLAPEDESVSSEPATDSAAQLPGGLKLQAIMYAGTKSGLIINGNLLHLGDSINGWEIVAVHEHEVVIQNGEAQKALTMR